MFYRADLAVRSRDEDSTNSVIESHQTRSGRQDCASSHERSSKRFGQGHRLAHGAGSGMLPLTNRPDRIQALRAGFDLGDPSPLSHARFKLPRLQCDDAPGFWGA